MPVFFKDLEGLTRVFGRVCAGISGLKLPLWADSSFLKFTYVLACFKKQLTCNPGFSAGLGLLGAGFCFFFRHFSSFKCRLFIFEVPVLPLSAGFAFLQKEGLSM